VTRRQREERALRLFASPHLLRQPSGRAAPTRNSHEKAERFAMARVVNERSFDGGPFVFARRGAK